MSLVGLLSPKISQYESPRKMASNAMYGSLTGSGVDQDSQKLSTTSEAMVNERLNDKSMINKSRPPDIASSGLF